MKLQKDKRYYVQVRIKGGMWQSVLTISANDGWYEYQILKEDDIPYLHGQHTLYPSGVKIG